MRYEPEVGKQYNSYTVIDETVETYKHGGRLFHVKCKCGKEEFKLAKHLESGRCKSCKSCSSKETAKNHPPPKMFKGVGGLSKTHFSAIKWGARRRKIPFDLSLEFLWGLYQNQQGLCALTSVPINLEVAIKGCNVDWEVITASLDRIDNTKSYQEGNVWWVHKEVNRLKNNYSLNELLFWCQKLILTHGNLEPSLVNEVEVTKKVQRLTGEDSTNKPDTSAQPPFVGG